MMNTELSPGSYPIHEFSPFLFEFSDGAGIRYYGLAYVLGFAIAAFLMLRAAKAGRTPLRPVQLESFLFTLILGVIVGGRLGSVLLYGGERYLAEPWRVFFIWEGGMASHGGFIGVCVAVLLFARHQKQSAFALGDLVCMAAPPGLFLGRVANFINGELWGKVGTVPWAWIFPDAPYRAGEPGYFEPALQQMVNPRHPSQLYEAALEGLLLSIYLLWRFWGSRGKRLPGQLVAEFLLVYSGARIFCEQFREPDASLILGLSRGSFYSLLSFAIGLALLIWLRRREAARAVQR